MILSAGDDQVQAENYRLITIAIKQMMASLLSCQTIQSIAEITGCVIYSEPPCRQKVA
jgi:hypothetical protein